MNRETSTALTGQTVLIGNCATCWKPLCECSCVANLQRPDNWEIVRYVFVGERRSARAKQLALSWRDGGLAAKPLFDAMRACGLDPFCQYFENAYLDVDPLTVNKSAIRRIKSLARTVPVVAMGAHAARALESHGIPHVQIVHPAARGTIRKRENYIAHVRGKLLRNA